jgi:L-gulonolactone oxidase
VGSRRHDVARPRFGDDVRHWNAEDQGPRLAIGNRRSYSDVCLLDGGQLVDMTAVDRFHSFDPQAGLLVADAGVTIDAVLKTFVPLGYFLPVTPGTRFVTLGGAIANDVHGKNHHRAGTFGRHVRKFVLERSHEGSIEVGPTSRPELFGATVGGLGLTGIITQVEIALARIPSSQLAAEAVACRDLEELCDGLEAGGDLFEHNVAWVDCTARGKELGRGILGRANWSSEGPLEPHRLSRRSIPTDRLDGLLNPFTLKLFNSLHYGRGKLNAGCSLTHYDPFLYPLDSVRHWNRLYGRSGFYQYQCVIPHAAGREPVRQLLDTIARSGEGSFLAVLKRFGGIGSPGLLSFPMPGLSLALDFRNRSAATLELLSRLDAIVLTARGRLYPAKDMRMTANAFAQGYPELESFSRFVDPACQSDFWKRVRP